MSVNPLLQEFLDACKNRPPDQQKRVELVLKILCDDVGLTSASFAGEHCTNVQITLDYLKNSPHRLLSLDFVDLEQLNTLPATYAALASFLTLVQPVEKRMCAAERAYTCPPKGGLFCLLVAAACAISTLATTNNGPAMELRHRVPIVRYGIQSPSETTWFGPAQTNQPLPTNLWKLSRYIEDPHATPLMLQLEAIELLVYYGTSLPTSWQKAKPKPWFDHTASVNQLANNLYANMASDTVLDDLLANAKRYNKGDDVISASVRDWLTTWRYNYKQEVERANMHGDSYGASFRLPSQYYYVANFRIALLRVLDDSAIRTNKSIDLDKVHALWKTASLAYFNGSIEQTSPLLPLLEEVYQTGPFRLCDWDDPMCSTVLPFVKKDRTKK